MILYEELSGRMIGAMIEVHAQLGPGLLESAYEACLCRELELRGIPFQRQVSLPVRYKGMELDCGYRLDLIVEEKIVIELKAVETLYKTYDAQVLTYLRLGGYRLGFLVNFCSPRLIYGLKRIIN